ncbi:MAG: EAL domain-containing protein, partial [Syntrophales bacterium LBB04]|nr:EAL domain-containing protein [Syntrophales bacterium LBB04]
EKTLMITNAVEEKKIVPYFQPIMNMQTGDIECYEVLSRIETDKGVLNACEFIEIAEKLGLISRLDLVLLENVFEKVTESGYAGRLFINLSPRSLILNEFMPNVLKLTRKFGIDKGRIVFEITERDTLKNITLLEKFIDNLKFEGFQFAIDDFGSGFSSFHYLKRFPLDFVKIEGEFIRNMIMNDKDMAIVKTLLVLTKEFKIRTVAEYVEHRDIYEAVKELGIDYSQGYFVGKPSPELLK